MTRTDEKIVYIIGAGASKADGIPLLDHIKDALKKLIDVCQKDSEIAEIAKCEYSWIDKENLKKALDFWEEHFPDKNIEEVMTYLYIEDNQDNKYKCLRDSKYLFLAVILYNKILNSSGQEGISFKEAEEILIKFYLFSDKYQHIDPKEINDIWVAISKFWKEKYQNENIIDVMEHIRDLSNEYSDNLKNFEYSYVAVIMYYAYHYDYYKKTKKECKHSNTYVKFMNKVLSENADIISFNVDNQICDCVYKDEEIQNKIIESSKQMQTIVKDVSDNESKERDTKGTGTRFVSLDADHQKEVIEEYVSALTDSWHFKFIMIHGSISYSERIGGTNHITPSINTHRDDLKNGNFRINYPNFNKKYDSNLNEALELIKNAEKIIIIGYSFPQSDFILRLKFYEAIFKNINNPEIEIINPDKNINLEVIPSKYRNKDRFRHITFENYLE